MARCSDRVDMAHWLHRFLLLDVPTTVKNELAEHLDGDHPTINPINFGELMGLPPRTARHVANHLENGPCPTVRILTVLQQENKTLLDVYCVLKKMNSSGVQVLENFWRHRAYQGISRGNQGHHSMDLQTEPSTCGCEGCQNNLSHSSSTQLPSVRQTSNFPPQVNDRDDSTLTKTVATDSEENLYNDQQFIAPMEPESDSDSISELMHSLEEIGSPIVQRSPASWPVYRQCSCQDHPVPADLSPSSPTSPISMPGPRNSQRPGGWQPECSCNGPEQVECSFSSSQPASSPPPPNRGFSSGSLLCGAPLHNEHNLPGPGNVPEYQSNFHLGSQQQHWNNQAPEVRAQPPFSPSSSSQLVHPQLQMSTHTPVSLENPQTAAPVVQATQQQALETAQQARNSSPAPSLRRAENLSPAQPKRQRPKSLSDPYVLVVYGEKDWKDDMEAEIQKAVLDLLCNNEISYVICSPNHRWHAQPQDLVNQDDVRRDNDAFRERIFRKARAIIMVITPKVKRYASPSVSTRDGVRQDVSNIVRSMRAEVSRPAGNTRVFPIIMAQLGANRKHNFDCLASTITYSFPSHVHQRDFICHLQKKLSQR